jgi:hypothetical protein
MPEQKLSKIDEKIIDKKIDKEVDKKVNKEVKEKINLYEKAIKPVHVFKQEFKQQTGTAIITAFSLLIALAWKDVITEFVKKINFAQGLIYSAIVVTIICVVGIIIVNFWAKPKEERKNLS